MPQQRLVTGIKPTGDIHLGNFFTAIRPVIEMQDQYDCYIFMADLHALNQRTDAEGLRRSIIEIAKAYLAAGLDPQRVALFQQSRLPHAELETMIGAQIGLGLLERAHAYKDAIAKGNSISYGLFSYPVLMAADILLYQAEVVPVGRDQHQHLEMTREIAERFNHLYGKTFVLPKAVETPFETIPGLDGRKMSKSYNNVIGLFDPPDVLEQKIAKIVTDSKRPEEPKDPNDTIGQLYKLVNPTSAESFLKVYAQGGVSYREAKQLLHAAVVGFLAPIQERKQALDLDEDQVLEVLEQGAARARVVADKTVEEVKQKLGLIL